MQNNKKKSSLMWTLILLIIIIGIIIYLIVNRFSQQTTVTRWQFDQDFYKALTNKDVFFKDVYVDWYIGTIKYVFHDNTGAVEIQKVANVGNWFANQIVSNNEIGNLTLLGQKASIASQLNIPATTNYIELLNIATNAGKIDISQLPFKETSVWQSLLLSILPTLIFVLLMYFLYRSMMKKSMNMMGGVIGEEKNPAQKIKSDKTFKDIAGNKEAIEEISEIVDYLKDPSKYQQAGARMPHGVLLGGPPGTGKTLLAKATAGEANVPFYFISASNFVEMFVGLGAKRVRSVVEEARKNAPAIIFIDELDAIGRTRGAGLGGGHDEREQTLNQLLVEMDGMKENNGILFFAATNRTDVLDPALTRPGRFDRSITVGLPDVKEREEILELHAKGKRISPSVSLTKVAKRTPGFSGAQLENVINEASLLAVRSNKKVIELGDIDEAIDRVMSGPAKKNRVITKEELTMVAYHEAGHAVVGIKVPGGNKVQKITIIPRGQAGGYNLMTPEDEKYNMSKTELIAMITSFMGGRAAERIIYGDENVSTGASDDISKATKIARKMVTEWGMSSLGPIQYEKEEGSPFLGRDYLKSAGFSNQIGHEIDVEVRKIMLEAENNAVNVIKENVQLLELIKTALLEKETIVAEEIEYIAKNLKLPPKEEKLESHVNYTLDELLQENNNEQIEKEIKEAKEEEKTEINEEKN
ncbi:Cell division protein FtsH [Mycoplasmopsis meleagridis]|uniref:ATP-dependent zinc metalloprotease FtsH n=1 Tax=Mycoplasmopsis meleagridis ATCC 25294 TaxID=1264554 RepID=A0A0F5H078_9BACT|nr:ATP-dependent zinc metalloprotease FtsH [Mycoplasmopsis meleagridis]KKB26694.1 Cell division protein FtsH [Mycoplasmopsis meleagridis ATCC 25294]OAD18190.1 Cell division protein FtsH [Mycoplasmopsis meleagridis]VEU77749.1 ATPase, AAA family [Mycoplasmopsis meleagridis]